MTQSKRDDAAEEYAKPLSKQGLPYIRLKDAYTTGYDAGRNEAIEEVLKKLWLAKECNSAIGLKKITPENCFQDFCNLVVACLSIKSLND